MSRPAQRTIFVSLLALAAVWPAEAQDLPVGSPIEAIEVTSNWPSLIEPVREAIPLQVGDRYSVESMRHTLQSLYALGSIAGVRVESTSTAGGLRLVFRVEANVRMWDIRFLGDPPWKRSQLRNELTVREGAVLDEREVMAQARRLQAALADDGYLLAEVRGRVAAASTPARGILELEVSAGTRARLGDIVIEAEGDLPAPVLRDVLGMPAGSPYRPTEFEAGIERVRARLLENHYFHNEIRVIEQSLDLTDSSVYLTVAIDSGPHVDLELSGLDFDEEELHERIAVFEFGTVEDWALKDSRHELVRWLQQRGHWRPLVSYNRQRDAEGRNIEVRFRVLAGGKARLKRIAFEGNDTVPATALRAAMRLQESEFLGPSRFRTDWWEEDQRAVLTAYRRRGFNRASVLGSRVEFDDAAGGIIATLQVEEGPLTRVSSVEVVLESAGAQTGITASLWDDAVELVAGGPFDQSAVRRDADRLRAVLANAGYPRALVASDVEDTANGAQVRFTLYTGERQRVSRVLVAGNKNTRDSVIERELAFVPGSPFSFADMLETQSRLYRTGLFSQVDVKPTTPDDLQTNQALVVRVQEAPPLFVTYGAGFDTEEKLRGTFTIGHNNVGGRNQQLSFATRASIREQRFRVLFREPYFLGRQQEATATAFYTNEQEASFKTQRVGVSLQLIYQHSDTLASLPRLVFRDTSTFDIQIDPDLIRPEDQSTRVGALNYSLVWDTRPDPVDPRSGHYSTADVELATRALGSNTNFATLFGRWFSYHAVNSRFTVALAARGGIKIPYGSSASIPLPERFFAGGSTTLRGFSLNGAGPADGNGNPLGGRVMLVANVELRTRLWGSFGAVAFADIGNVFALPESVSWTNVRETFGLGIRYATPVGPVRFDVARLMDRRPGEDAYQLFFSVGHAF